jgi:hypothetical protein
MAKEKSSKTNVTARGAAKAEKAVCRICGNPVEVVMRLPARGKRHMARLCCERAAAKG